MKEIGDLYLNYGIIGVIIIGIIFLMVKYVPKLIDIFIERMQKKDYREELFMTTIENNTRVIENNNIIIKAYTENENRLGEKFSTLITDFKRHDERAEDMAQDLKILKHK